MHAHALRPIWLDYHEFCEELETIRVTKSPETLENMVATARERASKIESSLAAVSFKSGGANNPASLVEKPSSVFTRAFSMKTLKQLNNTGPQESMTLDDGEHSGEAQKSALPGTVTYAGSSTAAAAPLSPLPVLPALPATSSIPNPVQMHL